MQTFVIQYTDGTTIVFGIRKKLNLVYILRLFIAILKLLHLV